MSNTLTAVTDKLLAGGVMALRENSLTPRLVNRRLEALAGGKGSTIDVPIPSAITAVQVSAAAVPPSTADIAPTSVPVPLDQWWEAPFYLDDKDMLEAMSGTIPMQATEAVKSIANKVDTYILGKYKSFYGYHGTAGTTPFGSGTTADATAIRKVLNQQLAPMDDRHVIFDPDAEAAALGVRAFQDGSYSGSYAEITNGNLNRKLGFEWWMNQNVLTHTAGVPGGTPVTDGTQALGATSVAVTGGGAAGTYLEGDIISFANHTQTYVVTANATLDGSGDGTVAISPALQVAVPTGNAITLRASHTVNMAFHRDAIAFVSRPFMPVEAGLGAIVRSATDPISGLAIRLEVTREHKRTRFSYDVLFGAAVVRPELGARLAG